jgi:hypothetical protein
MSRGPKALWSNVPALSRPGHDNKSNPGYTDGMADRTPEDRGWEDEDWDGDDLDSDDWSSDTDNDDEPTIPCPYCRREIFEDSVRCPHCGEYLSGEDAPVGPKPWWIILGVLLCLAAIWVWIARRSP